MNFIEKLKILIKQDNLYEFKSYAIYNNLNKSQININNFDILNYAIENNTSLALINYIITLYKGLNYEINDAEIPLYIAIQRHRFDIADCLIQQGANINFSSWNGDNILINFLKNNKLDIKNLKYILRHGIDINFEDEKDNRFLDYLINEQHISFLKTVLEHFVYSNSFILNMILLRKNKTQIDDDQFNAIIYQEKRKIKITKSMYIKTIKNNNLALLKLLIENDRTKHIMDIKNKYRLLLVASEINHWDIVIYLIENLKMKINERNSLHKTPLMFASEQGDKRIVEYLVRNGALVNDKDKNGLSPLIYACKNDKIDIVEFLLASKAIIDDRDRNGLTPLMYAAMYGHGEIITYLLDHGANIHARSKNGSSALTYAAMHNRKETTTLLLSYGLDINEKNSGGWTVLMHASKAGNLDIVKYLVEQGASVNERNVFSKTALIYASQNGHDEVVQYLLEHHAIDYRNQEGSLALMTAAQNGHRKVVECFIKNRRRLKEENKNNLKSGQRATVKKRPSQENLKENNKRKKSIKFKGIKGKAKLKNGTSSQSISSSVSPLSSTNDSDSDSSSRNKKILLLNNYLDEDILMVLRMATQNKRMSVVDYIVEESVANSEQKEALSRLAFFRAAEVNSKEIVDYFIGRGVPIDIQDDLGNTGLMIASSYGYDELVHYFLFHQADKNLCNNDHNTALHLACYGGFTSIVESLVAHGAPIDAKGFLGNTPLILACKDNNEAMMKCLVMYGADVNGRNHHGKTALFYASKYGRISMVEYLIGHGANPKLKSHYGCNAFLAALLKGHRPTVNYLIVQAMKEARNWRSILQLKLLKIFLFC
ncbi:ankyrin repeat-containing domain protein [Neocallimastix lanati (nom. inval.)]|jgi:ankyrin repeat protein|nr:ankyrin repeat-containing domain protein [Neocallimastix sp. JGI-2020a]